MDRILKSRLAVVSLTAMFTAIICVIAQFSVMTPFGVPITFQMSAIALCGYLLGVKWSAACVLTYILIGAVGLPVFSGFRGGINIIFGPTGGYIIGFLILAVFCGLSRKYSNRILKAVLAVIGVLLCYIFGAVQLILITEMTLNSAFLVLQTALLIKDILLCVAIHFLASYIEKSISQKRP